MRRFLFRFGALFIAILVGVFVMVVAQDVQRLQREHTKLTLRIEANTERLHVLEAEWAYLTRPASLMTALNKAEPDAKWIPIRGEAVIGLDTFLNKPPTRVAVLAPPEP
jgi:hypothetical protein